MSFRNWSRKGQFAALGVGILLIVCGYFLLQSRERNKLLNQVGVKELKTLQTPGLLKNIPTDWQYKLGFDRMMGIEVAKNSQLEEAIELLEPEKVTTVATYAGSRLFTNDGLKLLTRFPNLKSVHLRNTAVTDEGLKLLCDLPHLEELILDNNADLTGSGVSYLREAKTRTY
ncbi:MAG: hypothetical protein R3C11_13365 [Planctomycetaceae bacterium]